MPPCSRLEARREWREGGGRRGGGRWKEGGKREGRGGAEGGEKVLDD